MSEQHRTGQGRADGAADRTAVGGVATRAADALIRGYQVHLSPRKGWRCAHLVAHGGTSCSAAVRRIIGTRGLVRGAVPTALRFVACYRAAQLLMAGGGNVQGVCCCGGIPIPFRF